MQKSRKTGGMMMNPQLVSLYRYPVKGFSGEKLTKASLTSGGHFPCDRLYSIENGPTGFDADHPAWVAKQKFLVLMTLPQLAELQSRFDDESSVFTLTRKGAVQAEAVWTVKRGGRR